MLWLLIGYIWLFIHRPFEVWPKIGELHVELIYVLMAGMFWAVAAPKKLWPNPLHVAIAGFALAVLVCCLVSPWPEQSALPLEAYFKILVFYILLVSSVRDERDLRRVILGFMVAMFLYMLHSLWEFRNGRCIFRMGITRMVGVDSSFSDPNAFASTILVSLALVPAVWTMTQQKWLRRFLLGYVCLGLICIAFTGSRAAFVGLVLWGMVAIARSRWRWQLALAALLAAPFLWAALPEKLQNRFETIVNPEVGPRNAQQSAEGRLEGLTLGWQLWQDNPVTGIGPGTWCKATGREIQSHNLYGQLMGEMGTLGIITFGLLLIAVLANLRAMRRAYRQHPEWNKDFLYYLGQGLGTGFFLLLFEGNFGHNLFRYHWLWFAAFLVIARGCVEQRLQAESDPESRPVVADWGAPLPAQPAA
jgi:O-antigen ligase